MSKEVKKVLREEMDRRGIQDNVLRAGIAAIVGGESGFKPHSETSYAHTSNARIRTIFRDRVRDLSDSELSELKANAQDFFNYVYGGEWGRKNLGNTEPNDGYNFRGRGPNQLTGRGNYIRIGRICGHPEIVTNPDLVNDPVVGTSLAVGFLLHHYKGDGWEGLKRVQGGNVGTEKDRLYSAYIYSGEWNYNPKSKPTRRRDTHPAPVDDIEPLDPVVETFLESVENVQRFFRSIGLYDGEIDRDFGPASRRALKTYLRGN